MTPNIRKLIVLLDETHSEMARQLETPRRKVAVAAIIANPFAGEYIEDVEPLYDLGAEVGGLLATRGVEALGVQPDDVTGYGKGAIIGTDGEIEHAAAVLHPRFGAPVRAAVDHGDDIITSTKIVAGPGTPITIPLTNKNSIWEFDDMDSMQFSTIDGPRADEMLIVVALAVGGRPLARTNKDQ